jgi:hypothetical protein
MSIKPLSSVDYIKIRDSNFSSKIQEYLLTDSYKEWENERLMEINSYLNIAAIRNYKIPITIDIDPPLIDFNETEILKRLVAEKLADIYRNVGYNVQQCETSDTLGIGFGIKTYNSFTLTFNIQML